MSDTGMDLLLGGAPAAKFPNIGDKIVGTVLSQQKQQSKDMASGTLKTWDDGSPVWEIVFVLQTDERDPEIEDDDGTRRLFARGQMLKAIGQALRKANWKNELVGGKLGVKYTGDGTPAQRGFSAPKVYAAVFSAPDPADEFDAIASEPEPSWEQRHGDPKDMTNDAYGEEPF